MSSRQLIRNAAELLGIWGLAGIQPILEDLIQAPEALVLLGVGRWDLVIFLLIWSLLPVAVILAIEAVVSIFSRRSSTSIHLLILALGVGIWVIQLGKEYDQGLLGTAAILVLITSVLVFSILKSRAVLSVLGLVILVFPASFYHEAQSVVDSAKVSDNTHDKNELFLEIEDPSPIFFVMFDALPLRLLLDDKGAIDSDLYPNFAEIANGATFYREMYSVGSETRAVLPALLSGRYPEHTAVEELPLGKVSRPSPNLVWNIDDRYSVNVLEVIDARYRREAVTQEAGGWRRMLSAARSMLSLRINTEYAPEDITEEVVSFADQPAVLSQKLFKEALEKITQLDSQFHFLHPVLPHPGYVLDPYCREYDSDYPPLLDNPYSSDVDARRYEQGMVLQLQCSDRLLGLLLDRLRDLGIYEKALVVVVADHGEAFVGGKPPRHISLETVQDIVRVPLIVKAPFQRGGEVSDRKLSSVDVLPLIARLLDTPIPWEIDGDPDGSIGAEADVVSLFVRESMSELPIGPSGVLELPLSAIPSFAEIARSRPKNVSGSLHGYSLGSHGYLVGGSDLLAIGGDRSDVTLERGMNDLGSVEDGVVRLVVKGHAPEDVESIALTIDGRVASVAEVDHQHGGRFSLIAPSDLIVGLEPELALLAISGARGDLRTWLLSTG